MVITHTVNHEGQRRIYLGGKFCLDGWLEPKDDGVQWRFRFDASQAHGHIGPDDIVEWAKGLMAGLARELEVDDSALDAVPFEAIAKLHTTPNSHCRRIPSPQREIIETGYMPTPHGVKRSKADFSAPDFKKFHNKGRTKGRK